MRFTAPDYSEDEIESAASQLLSDYFSHNPDDDKLPTPIEMIAEYYLGYELAYTDEGLFADASVLGGICFDTKMIFINTAVESHEGRHAFTIAHEIGHHVLHKPYYKSTNNLLCRNKDKPLHEIQADRFAAALLLPKYFIDKHWLYSQPDDIYHLYRMVKTFLDKHQLHNVSLSTCINRLIELGHVNDVSFQKGKPRRRRKHFIMWLIERNIIKYFK